MAERGAGTLDRALAVVLAVWGVAALLPVGTWLGLATGEYYADTWALWARTIGVAALVTLLLLVLTRGAVAGALRQCGALAGRARPAAFLATLGTVAAVEAAFVADRCFARNPQSIDAWAQAFQARVFLSGALVAPSPPSVAHFAILHVPATTRGWFAQFPPLHPALLAVGMAAGGTWLVTPLLAALLPAVVYRLGIATAGEREARVAAVLAVLSPFVIAMDASAMNHLPAALCVAVGLAAIPGVAAGRPDAAGAFGLATGLALGLRPLDGGVLGALGGAALVWATVARRAWRPLGVATAAGGVALVPTLVFNAATTGSPFTYAYSAVWGEGLRLGLGHDVPWGERLTFARALGLTALDAHQLNVYLLEWPVPVTVLAALGAWRGGRRTRPLAAYVVALVAALFFYFHRDTLYGPRLLFSLVPAVCVLVASGLVAVADVRAPAGWRALTVGDVALTGVVVVAAVAAALLAPRRLASYATTGTVLAAHPDADARRAGITHAVVLIPDGWGSRLIVRMWAAGVPMAQSNAFYQAFDACGLEEQLDAAARAHDGRPLGERLTAALADAGPGVVVPGLTHDPLLRLPADHRVTTRCVAEITRDQHDALQFAPFLHLNTPTLDGDVVWARELGDDDAVLARAFPGRAVYRYILGDDGPRFETAAPLPLASAAPEQ
jgi:hypothetical protein